MWLSQLDRARFVGSKRSKVAGILLAVDHFNPMMATGHNQRRERYLGSVGNQAEHGLAEHSPTDGDAVQAADEFTPDPGFDAVREAILMQTLIG